MEPDKAIEPWDHYVQGVVGGVTPACETIRLACERHLLDLKRAEEDPSWPYEFRPNRAEHAIKFFQGLQLTKGLPFPGKRFEPELWQKFILAMLFGWVRRTDGLRRFRHGSIWVPRKNGKSPILAGIGLYGLLADKEMGAEVYSVATKKDQARVIWDFAVDFRRFSPGLMERCEKSVNALFVRKTSSKFQALASEEDGLDGLNVFFGFVDEFQNHKTDAVNERISTGVSARRQPMVLRIGTAGTALESPGKKEHDYALNILKRIFEDDTYFAFVAEADEGADWRDEETWRRCNPNLGVSKSWDYMRMQAQGARNQPSKLNAFKRLDLNIWTQQDHVYLPMDKWNLCGGSLTVIEGADPAKGIEGRRRELRANDYAAIEDEMARQWRQPFAGLDLSEKHDITALAMLFPPTAEHQKWVVVCKYFCPEEDVPERTKNDRVPYERWVSEGRMFATPGSVVDYEFVKAEVWRLHQKLRFQALGCDPWNTMALANMLRSQGMQVFDVVQGYKSLSDPMKELMAWVLGRKLLHLNDPVLTWMASNLGVSKDPAGNVKPDKAKSRERIDGMAAMVNAMHLALSKTYSVYSSRGILTI